MPSHHEWTTSDEDICVGYFIAALCSKVSAAIYCETHFVQEDTCGRQLLPQDENKELNRWCIGRKGVCQWQWIQKFLVLKTSYSFNFYSLSNIMCASICTADKVCQAYKFLPRNCSLANATGLIGANPTSSKAEAVMINSGLAAGC